MRGVRAQVRGGGDDAFHRQVGGGHQRDRIVLDGFANSGVDGDAPACPNRDDTQRCMVVARAADIKLNILGYAVYPADLARRR